MKNKRVTATVPANLAEAFRDVCRTNEWTTNEVIEYLLQHAVEMDYKLLYSIHRLRKKKERGEKWERPESDWE